MTHDIERLIERLRRTGHLATDPVPDVALCHAAADALESLRPKPESAQGAGETPETDAFEKEVMADEAAIDFSPSLIFDFARSLERRLRDALTQREGYVMVPAARIEEVINALYRKDNMDSHSLARELERWLLINKEGAVGQLTGSGNAAGFSAHDERKE